MVNFVKKYLSENTGILIRIDDIAENMNWPLMKRCEALFDKYNIKPLLGVISNNKDPELQSYPKNESFWTYGICIIYSKCYIYWYINYNS